MAPSLPANVSSRFLMSGSTALDALPEISPESRRLTSDSVCRTDSPRPTTVRAVFGCSTSGKARSALACPISRSPRSNMRRASVCSPIRRIRLVTVTLDLPTASATSCCVSSNSSCSRFSAMASSIGLRFSRWIFSIRAMAIAASSPTGLIIAGILSNPANWLARQRRSPAMISYFSLEIGRITIGCMTPCFLIDAASSSKASSCILVRG